MEIKKAAKQGNKEVSYSCVIWNVDWEEFLLKVSSLNNPRLQGTSSLYVYKELRIQGTFSHGPEEFVISGVYCM